MFTSRYSARYVFLAWESDYGNKVSTVRTFFLRSLSGLLFGLAMDYWLRQTVMRGFFFFASYSFRIVVWIDVRLSSLSIILLVMRTARKLIFLFIHYFFSMGLLGPVGFGPISLVSFFRLVSHWLLHPHSYCYLWLLVSDLFLDTAVMQEARWSRGESPQLLCS